MSVGPLIVEITVVFGLVFWFLHRYGNLRKQTVMVTVAAFLSWYFSFLIVVILPLDVSSTIYRQCLHDQAPLTTTTFLPTTSSTTTNSSFVTLPSNVTGIVTPVGTGSNASTASMSNTLAPVVDTCNKPWSYFSPLVLPVLWRIIYWSSQVLTWLLLPMMQSYAKAGDFSIMGKIRSAIISNAIYYGTYLLIFSICLIYVAIKPNIHLHGDQLKVLAITASNTWGLFLLVLLLGYGLVEVPRALWNSSQKGYMLSHAYFKAAKLSVEKSEAEENLEDVLEDVKKASETIRYNHPLRRCVDTILKKCPESVQQSVQTTHDDYQDYAHNPTETPTEKSLVRLHTNVMWYSLAYTRTQTQWGHLMDKIVELEDMESNVGSSRRLFVRSDGRYDGWFNRCYTPTVEWYWKCYFRPVVLKVLALCSATMSFMVVWSEVLFFVKSPVLSMFAIFVGVAQQNYNYFAIELTCIMTIAYLCVCAYYTVFKVRFFNYYYLAAPHQTNEYSLIFCGMMLCRLTPPLCLNFLGLIHLDSHITSEKNLEETAYTQIMGHLDVLSFIANGFNIYFPILIVVLCIANYFHLVTRILHCFGFQQFISDDEMTTDLEKEGKQLVNRERRKRERMVNGESRRRNWTDRFGGSRNENSSTGDRVYRDNPGTDYNNGGADGVGGHPVMSSPDDHAGLLQEAEPMDYRRDRPSYNDRYGGQSRSSADRYGSQGSQSSRGLNTGSINDTGDGKYSTGTGRKTSRPPKDIFDDI